MNYYSSYGRSVTAAGLWVPIVALVLGIVGTVLAYIFIMPKNKVKNLNKFWYFVHNVFNFKTLLVEKIFKALYVFLTIFVICYGFFQLFVSFLSGLLILLLGPILVRITYEMIMMFILLVQNIAAIKAKLCDDEEAAPAQPAAEKKAPREYVFCAACGTRYDQAEGQCPACGRMNAPAQPQQSAQPVQQQPQYQQPVQGYQQPAYPQRPAQTYPQNGVERQGYAREHRRYQMPTQE